MSFSLTDNLVSYWKLDGNSNDSVGSNNGSDTSVTYSVANGKIIQGAGFNGSTSKIAVADAANLSPSGSLTLNAWVYVNNYRGGYTGWVGKNTETGNQREYVIAENDTGNNVIMVLYGTGAGTGSVSKTFTRPATGGWHMLTMVFISASQLEAYLDGVSQGTTATSTVGVTAGTGGFGIGGNIQLGGITTPIDGNIDEVGLWSRSLTSEEVTTLYNNGQGLQYPFTLDSTPRYWVGGTGTWDTSTTHWSLTSGGASGASVPNYSTTAVYFDANSGGGTVTTGNALSCVNLDFTGFTGTFAGSDTLNVAGNLTIASGMTLSYTGAITFSSTSTGKTITTAGKTILSVITFDGVGGGWTLQDALTSTGASMTLTNGNLNLNNFNVSVPTFVSSSSNTRALTMGSGTITLTGTGTVWSCATSTNFTITPNTSTIKLTDASASTKTFAGGGKTYANLWITGAGSGAYTISGSNTFNDFKVDTPPHTLNFTAGTTTTVASWTVSGTSGNLITLQSTSSGTAWNLVKSTSGYVSSDYLSIKDCHASAS